VKGETGTEKEEDRQRQRGREKEIEKKRKSDIRGGEVISYTYKSAWINNGDCPK